MTKPGLSKVQCYTVDEPDCISDAKSDLQNRQSTQLGEITEYHTKHNTS